MQLQGYKWTIALFFAALCSSALLAQGDRNTPKDLSPYSRLGLGDLLDQNLNAVAGMGGALSATYHDLYHLNLLNPASFASLKATAFEIGIYGQLKRLESSKASTNAWSGNLNYLALGFPLKNSINEILDRRRPSKYAFGMGISLQPFSLVGYQLQSSDSVRGTGLQQFEYFGKGGTYKLQWSNAVKYKNFSFGLNLGYFFGRISNERYVYFNELSASYFNYFLDDFNVGGFVWRAGAQYDYLFRKKNQEGEMAPTGKKIVFGLYGNSATSFTANSNSLYLRYNSSYYDPNRGTVVRDTIRYTPTPVPYDGKLPAEFGLGVSYEKENKYRLGFNYSWAGWSQYENGAKPGEILFNSWRIAAGGELTPDYISYNNYFKRIRYRGGLFYATDPRTIRGSQLVSYGVALGAGFPVLLPRQQTSFVNVTVEAGQSGLSSSLQQTYVRLGLGFTLNDNTWFYKQRYQ